MSGRISRDLGVPLAIDGGDLDYPAIGMAFLRNVAIAKGVLTLSNAP